jgi:DNA-binding transcriptional regulator YdaS (Cro superfamily)
MVNVNALRIALVQNGMPQWRLAKKLGYEPSTFSDYVRGARRSPPDLTARIERALKLPGGSLAKSPERRANNAQ